MGYVAQFVALGLVGMAIAAFQYRNAWRRIGATLPHVALFGLSTTFMLALGIYFALTRPRLAYDAMPVILGAAAVFSAAYCAYTILNYYAGKDAD